jgi:D-alanyl-lipoteichoic acid acyltransferase DltB (MBOAT superfamily)
LKYWGIIIAVTLTFALSGVWHGIGFTFLIYALSHALYLIIETFIKKPMILNKSASFISVFFTFNLVSLSFVFFRSTSFEQSFHKLNSIFSFPFFPRVLVNDFIQYIAIGGEQENIFNLYVTIILTALFLVFEKRIFNRFNSNQINKVGLIILLLIISFFGIFDESKNFIYSQF